MSPPIRRQLAMTYSRMLMMSSAAERKGLDKSPQFEQVMLYSRMLALSQALGRALQEDANNVSDADIDKSYNDNKVAYEEATLERIFIPHTKQILPAPKPKPGAAKTAPKMSPEEEEKASEPVMKKLATTIHMRAAKGESFDALQREVYQVANVRNSTTSTKMEKTRQNMLPPAQKAVMELKPGEVSEVYSDPSGYYIYKMVSKDTLPLDSVRTEIHNAIASQRYRDAMQVFQLGPKMDLSETYFGASKNPNPPSPQKGDQPPVDADDDPD
jgi:parvulin-like peptidyl-prolyl isomerase